MSWLSFGLGWGSSAGTVSFGLGRKVVTLLGGPSSVLWYESRTYTDVLTETVLTYDSGSAIMNVMNAGRTPDFASGVTYVQLLNPDTEVM